MCASRPVDGSLTTLAAARLQRLEALSDRVLQDSVKTQGLLTKLQTKVQVSRQDTRLPLRRVRCRTHHAFHCEHDAARARTGLCVHVCSTTWWHV